MRLDVNVRGKVYRVELNRSPEGELSAVQSGGSESAESGRRKPDLWTCRVNGHDFAIDVVQVGPETLSIICDGKPINVTQQRSRETREIFLDGAGYQVSVQDTRSLASRKRAGGKDEGTQKLSSAMPGKVVRVLAQEGAEVALGQGIVVIEAMKMQNEVRSPKNGILRKLLVQAGTNINAGDVLAMVE